MGELGAGKAFVVCFFPALVALGKTEPGAKPGQGLEGSVQYYYD